MLNVPDYLGRIGCSSLTQPTAETLRALHRAHMYAIPFENLDIHIGRQIICEEPRFLHKIINERRGGFCYELNGAFAALLRALGFQVILLSARVTRADGSDGAEFDHLALRVDIPASAKSSPDMPTAWLVDVGFGDSFLEPLLLEPDLEQPQIRRIYRLIEIGSMFHMEVMNPEAANSTRWKREYSFSLEPRRLEEFSGRCHYHQTSPNSSFTRQRICSRATPHGRITLSDLKLIETLNGQRQERSLSGEQEWRETLQKLFGIELPA